MMGGKDKQKKEVKKVPLKTKDDKRKEKQDAKNQSRIKSPST
jgi:hypothetical protein